MHFFENPLVLMAVLAIGVVILLAISICLALRGAKAANNHSERTFTSLNKMDRMFRTLGKSHSSRLVLILNLSTNNLIDLHSKEKLFSEINNNLLDTFADNQDYFVSDYDDKYFVILSNENVEAAKEKSESFVNDINKMLPEYNALNIVGVVIGAYDATGVQVSFDVAIERAKQACILANNEDKSFAEWSASSGKALEKKIKIENNIENEIDNNRFFLVYQPVLDAKTKKIIGAEVLSRLNSESEGVLSPNSFLAAVDSVGINGKFDYYIFEKNCKWISNDKKQREGYKYTINFSRSTISDPKFVEKITGIAEKYDLKFSCLAVEILEDKNIKGEAKQRMIDNLSVLKERGISVLLDDFGSGYTTFGDLQNIDISILKIDKSITQNSVTETGFKILKNIIQTAQEIGFKTLCEGIETKEQEEAVIAAGCDLLQGFYYYRPMSVANLENLFDNTSGGN